MASELHIEEGLLDLERGSDVDETDDSSIYLCRPAPTCQRLERHKVAWWCEQSRQTRYDQQTHRDGASEERDDETFRCSLDRLPSIEFDRQKRRWSVESAGRLFGPVGTFIFHELEPASEVSRTPRHHHQPRSYPIKLTCRRCFSRNHH